MSASVSAQYMPCLALCCYYRPEALVLPSTTVKILRTETDNKLYWYWREMCVCVFSVNSKCENVVDQWVQESQYRICERCDCQWQRRNTTTIKVLIMIISLLKTCPVYLVMFCWTIAVIMEL